MEKNISLVLSVFRGFFSLSFKQNMCKKEACFSVFVVLVEYNIFKNIEEDKTEC